MTYKINWHTLKIYRLWWWRGRNSQEVLALLHGGEERELPGMESSWVDIRPAVGLLLLLHVWLCRSKSPHKPPGLVVLLTLLTWVMPFPRLQHLSLAHAPSIFFEKTGGCQEVHLLSSCLLSPPPEHPSQKLWSSEQQPQPRHLHSKVKSLEMLVGLAQEGS